MKKIYFTFALVLLTCTLAHASELVLRVNRKGQFVVSASNQTQTSNINNYTFYNLYGGNTPVKIVEKSSGQIIFKNTVNIPDNTQLVAELDQFGNLTIVESNTLGYNNGGNGGWSGNGNVGTVNYGNNGNGNYGGGYQHNHCGTHPNNQGDGYYNQGQTNNSNLYFNQFLSSLRSESFDSNRLQNAKVYAAKTNLSASQIKDIAATFTFDSNRLDWAKAAYNSCYDKGNYFLLRETFTFSSSYSDLQDYVSVQ
ncbi:MAG: DUF4476 domain-containing protein [Fluviicola sp.]